ncbi:MAG: DUF1476 domain-containing protein [Planctomycetota bacterium]
MSGIDDRRKGMDTKLGRDSELKFKVTNRRNKLLGYWAADKLGVTGEKREALAKSVVLADFEEPGDEDVLRKVLGCFDEHGQFIDHDEVRAEMENLLPVALEQVNSEG